MLPGDRAALGPLEVDLGDAVVLEDGDALLAHVDGDEQLALRGRQRCPPRRRAASLAAGGAFLSLLGTALLGLRADRLGFLLRRGRGGAVAPVGRLRPLPPRVPRRRLGLAAVSVSVTAAVAAGRSGASVTGAAACAGACSRSGLRRRNHRLNGKRNPLYKRARLPVGAQRSTGGIGQEHISRVPALSDFTDKASNRVDLGLETIVHGELRPTRVLSCGASDRGGDRNGIET